METWKYEQIRSFQSATFGYQILKIGFLKPIGVLRIRLCIFGTLALRNKYINV